MIRIIVLAVALTCCVVANTRAELDKYCTVSFEGAISVRTQTKDYGTISVAIKPTAVLASPGPYGQEYGGKVELYYRSLDPDILVHDRLRPNCTFVGATGRMVEGYVEVYVDTTKTPYYRGIRIKFADGPKEAFLTRCNDTTAIDSLQYWFTQYMAAYEMPGNGVYYEDLSPQAKGAGKVDRRQMRRTDVEGVWITDVVTTVEITDGAAPVLHFGRSGLELPLIPGVPTLTDWGVTLAFGKDTVEGQSAEMTIDGERYQMTKRDKRYFDYYEVDVAGHATWRDTAVPVSVRMILNDGTVLVDTAWQPLIRRPDWLVEGTEFEVSTVPNNGSLYQYSFTGGIMSGRLSLPFKEPVWSFYSGPDIHPLFKSPMGFSSFVDVDQADGAFRVEERWNYGEEVWGASPKLQDNWLTIPFMLFERFDFRFRILPLFSVVGRELRLAYALDDRNARSSMTLRGLRRMDDLYSSMMTSMEAVATRDEIARIAGTTLQTDYDGSLSISTGLFTRIGNDMLVPIREFMVGVDIDIESSQSIDVNEYLTIHATTDGDLEWSSHMNADSIESTYLRRTQAEQIVLADVLGDVFLLHSRSYPTSVVPTSVIQPPSHNDIPSILVGETNERRGLDSRQRNGARPAIAVGADGVRATVWSTRHVPNTGRPVIAVAATTDMTSSLGPKLLYVGSSQFWVHRPDVVFDGQNRMIVVWESAQEAPRSSKPDDVAAYLTTIRLRWAAIDMKKWKAVDSGQVDVAPARGVQLHTAPDGTVHAFWKSTYNAATSSSSIKHSTWNGQKWSAPEVVMFDVTGMSSWNSAVRSGDRMIVAVVADGRGYSAVPGAGTWSIQDHGPAENILPLLTDDGRRQVVIRVDSALVVADHDELVSRTQFGRDDMGLAFSRAKARMDGNSLLLAGVRNDGLAVIRHDGLRTTVLSEPQAWGMGWGEDGYIRWGSVLWLDGGTVDYSLATISRNGYYEEDDTRILIGRFPLDVVTSSEEVLRQGAGVMSYAVSSGHRLTFASSAGTYEWYDVMGRLVHRMEVAEGAPPVCPELVAGTYFVDGPGYRGAVLVR